MDNTIRMYYVDNQSNEIHYISYTGSNNLSQLRTYITGTIGDGSASSTTRLVSVNLEGVATGNGADLFNNCQALDSLYCPDLDTSNVTAMYNMFYNCKALTSLDLSNWDTSNVVYMHNMFSSCTNLTELNIIGFDLSSCTSANGIFSWSSKLVTIYCNDDWANFSTVTSHNGMFSGCSRLVGAISYDSTKVNINYANPTTGYFTRLITDYDVYFNGTQLEHIYFNGTEIDSLYFNGTQII